MISIPFRYFTADIMQSDIQRWRDTATYDISEKTYIYNIIDSTYSIIIFQVDFTVSSELSLNTNRQAHRYRHRQCARSLQLMQSYYISSLVQIYTDSLAVKSCKLLKVGVPIIICLRVADGFNSF